MGYATTDDIKRLFRELNTTVTKAAVDEDDITLFITNSTAVIDAKIGMLYKLPIDELSNPQSFSILKQLQMFQVACIVDDILNSYSSADKKPTWCKKAEVLMDSLVPPRTGSENKQPVPTMELPDANYLGTGIQRNQIRIGKTTGTIFRKGAKNW